MGLGQGGTPTIGVTAVVQSATLPSNGTSPTGTVTFSTATPRTTTLIPGFDPNGNAIATASIVVGQNDIPASGNISATYNPAGTEVNYTGSTSSPVSFTSSNALINTTTTTTFTITDNYGTYPSSGTYPNASTPSFPVLDSITLNMHVVANQPANSVFLVYANGVLLTPATWSGGFLTGGGITPDNNGNATYTIPQQNGYLALPSGQVQFTVLYDGWIYTNGTQQSDPSAANQIVTIVDDRTSADFSLQSDTTVNQGKALLASTSTATATYNLRLTSLYNFQSAYASTPINLSCKVVGYSLAGVRSAPAGLTCGFGALSTSTASVTLGGSGFATQTLVVGAASGYSIASNTVPVQPATRWWMAGGGATLACIFLTRIAVTPAQMANAARSLRDGHGQLRHERLRRKRSVRPEPAVLQQHQWRGDRHSARHRYACSCGHLHRARHCNHHCEHNPHSHFADPGTGRHNQLTRSPKERPHSPECGLSLCKLLRCGAPQGNE